MPARRWRKKPVEIDAWQWDGSEDEAFAIQKWVNEGGGSACYVAPHRGPATLTISTLEGQMTVSLGDFVIRGIQGEFYPCKPDIFAGSYDLVED